MKQSNIPVQSLKTLIISTVSAILLAIIILVSVVMPAEYGIDLTGFGKLTGLTVLSQPLKATVESLSLDAAAVTVKTEALVQDTTLLPPMLAEKNSGVPLSIPPSDLSVEIPMVLAKAKTTWQHVVVITVPPASGLEYKFHVNKNDPLEYSWVTDGPTLYFDFHGEPAGDKTGYFKSFKAARDMQSEGILTAPFTGVHGWYWQNKSKLPVKVTLKTRGKYTIKGLI